MPPRQPFRPNDAIEIDGDEGKVIRLTSRATILLNWDGNHVRIPNATVYKARILNFSRNPERRFSFDIGVAYGTDLAAAKALADATIAGLPYVLKAPAANSWITELGGSEIGMTIAGWIDQRETDLQAARTEAIRQLLLAFERAGIEMPEPTYRLLTAEVEDGHAEAAAPRATAGAPADAAVQDVAATPEHELETLVNEERADSGTEDLLALGERRE